ncbi:MAG: protein kinase [Rubrivivax sp.]|nr:protein kinase [Rubrivivax sp.]
MALTLFKRPPRKEGPDSEFAATVASLPPGVEAAVPLPASDSPDSLPPDSQPPDSLPPDSLTFDSLPPDLPEPPRAPPSRPRPSAAALPPLPAVDDSVPPEADAAPAGPFEPHPAAELPPYLGGPAPKPTPEPAADDDSLPMADQPTIAQVGRYALKRALGLGGLGQVHEAWDPLLGRTVAIKTLQFESDPRTRSALDRLFLNEARAVAGLSHPHIVTVHDAGLSPQGVYLAMERLQGKDLRQRLQEGWRPGPAVAAQLVRRVADALAYAHARGVVHCDIKPGNIFITGSDKPKVLDFGIARVAHGRAVPAALQGTVAGSPHYLAPEQLLGKEVDARTDIYSLGVVFYELLSGRRAFGGDSVEQITTAVLTNHPAPAHLIRSGVPEALSAIAARAMARDTEARYATASEMAADIRAWFDQPRAAAPSKEERAEARRLKKATQRPAPRRWPWAVAGATAALLAIAAAGLLVVMRAGPQPGASEAAASGAAPSGSGATAAAPLSGSDAPATPAAGQPGGAAGREGDIVLSGGVPVMGTTPNPAAAAVAASSSPGTSVAGATGAPAAPGSGPPGTGGADTSPATAPGTRAQATGATATGPAEPRPTTPRAAAAGARNPAGSRDAQARRAAAAGGAGSANAAPSPATATGMGTLQLAISPWGQVEVNGQPAGTAPPLTQLTLPVGNQVITVRNADFPPITVTVQVQADKPAWVRHRFGQ